MGSEKYIIMIRRNNEKEELITKIRLSDFAKHKRIYILQMHLSQGLWNTII